MLQRFLCFSLCLLLIWKNKDVENRQPRGTQETRGGHAGISGRNATSPFCKITRGASCPWLHRHGEVRKSQLWQQSRYSSVTKPTGAMQPAGPRSWPLAAPRGPDWDLVTEHPVPTGAQQLLLPGLSLPAPSVGRLLGFCLIPALLAARTSLSKDWC